MIAITGANGNIGRHLTQALGTAGIPARLLMRQQSRTATSDGRLEVAVADLDRPETLDMALAGITQLFLVSPGPNTPAQDAGAIAAAQRAGVHHIVLLSSLGVELGGIGGGKAHAPGEDILARSGLDWTILRPSEFMTNTLGWLPEVTARGTISAPTGNGRVGFIDPADIAAVAFAALTVSGHVGKTYRLTGPETLSTADVATRFGAMIGRSVQHIDVSDSDFRTSAHAAHMPEMMIDILGEYYGGVKEGRMDILTSDVEQIVGRRPDTFADWARTNIASAR
ncbi:MAG: SDR family oxidoreductase [Herpetosiphon sp.]